MSYARWSYSEWYVFWTTGSGTTRDTQRLAVWLNADVTPHFYYPEVKRWVEDDLFESLGCHWGIPQGDSVPEVDTLRSCCRQWILDVETEHDEPKGEPS